MTVPPTWGPLRLPPWLRRLWGRNADRIGDGGPGGDRAGGPRGPGVGRTAGIAIMVTVVATIAAAAIMMRGATIGTDTTTRVEPAITSATAPMPALPVCDGCSPLPGLLSADTVPDAPATPAPPNDPAVQASMPGCAQWTDPLCHLPARRGASYMLEYRDCLPAAGGGLPPRSTGGGEASTAGGEVKVGARRK